MPLFQGYENHVDETFFPFFFPLFFFFCLFKNQTGSELHNALGDAKTTDKFIMSYRDKISCHTQNQT